MADPPLDKKVRGITKFDIVGVGPSTFDDSL